MELCLRANPCIVIGYIGLLMFMGFLASAFIYIFRNDRYEKMHQYKLERNKKRTMGRDRMKKKKGGTKHLVLLCSMICIMFTFLFAWMAASSEYGCQVIYGVRMT
jgi:hypothetical protein